MLGKIRSFLLYGNSFESALSVPIIKPAAWVWFFAVRMKDANGFHVDVVSAETAPIEKDLTLIRINVDDFDEGKELLLSKGFRESMQGHGKRVARIIYLADHIDQILS